MRYWIECRPHSSTSEWYKFSNEIWFAKQAVMDELDNSSISTNYEYRIAEQEDKITYVPVSLPSLKSSYKMLERDNQVLKERCEKELKNVEHWKREAKSWEEIYHKAMSRMREALEKS